jgi:hypothetical protein
MNENVTFTELDDAESVLLHLKTRRYFSLNETGTLIWQQLRQGKEVDEIAALLEQQYELDTAEALKHVKTFLDRLVQDGLLEAG